MEPLRTYSIQYSDVEGLDDHDRVWARDPEEALMLWKINNANAIAHKEKSFERISATE